MTDIRTVLSEIHRTAEQHRQQAAPRPAPPKRPGRNPYVGADDVQQAAEAILAAGEPLTALAIAEAIGEPKAVGIVARRVARMRLRGEFPWVLERGEKSA